MAAENVLAIKIDEAAPIIHPDVDHLFTAWDPLRGRYIADEALRIKYPDD